MLRVSPDGATQTSLEAGGIDTALSSVQQRCRLLGSYWHPFDILGQFLDVLESEAFIHFVILWVVIVRDIVIFGVDLGIIRCAVRHLSTEWVPRVNSTWHILGRRGQVGELHSPVVRCHGFIHCEYRRTKGGRRGITKQTLNLKSEVSKQSRGRKE